MEKAELDKDRKIKELEQRLLMLESVGTTSTNVESAIKNIELEVNQQIKTAKFSAFSILQSPKQKQRDHRHRFFFRGKRCGFLQAICIRVLHQQQMQV